MKKNMNNKGFSLVELIIVVAIMAVLVGVAAPQYMKYVGNSKVSTDISNAQSMATAINVAVAEGNSTVYSQFSGDVAVGTAITGVPGLTNIPVVKWGSSYYWNFDVDTTNGVKTIKITDGTNTYDVYPDANIATGHYKVNHK